MYTLDDLKMAVHILSGSPFWVRYSVAVKSAMARELAGILHMGNNAQVM